MRLLCLLGALLPGATIFSASALTASSSSPLFDPQPCPSLPFSFPRYAHREQPKKGLLAQWQQWRDRAIRLLWNPPSPEARDPAAIISSHADLAPPTSLPAQYSDDAVLRFRIQSEAEAAALAEAVTVLFLDVWEFSTDWVDIRLSKRVLPSLLGLLPPSLQRAHTPLMYDLAQAIFDTYPSPPSDEPVQPKPRGYRTFSPALHPPAEETNILFRNYQPLSVLVPWMRLLTSLFPTHVRLISIGVSYEGRDIHALRVGVHPTNSEQPLAPRKTIIVVGGSHAREWISTSSVAFVAYSLITEYGKTPAVTKLLEEFDWIFVPTVNPDGYVYTWERDRLWRKNRQHTSLRFCKGIDLDRAYGFEWEDASGNNPCSESFSGDRPWEAVETRQFANWVRNETDHKRANFVGFLDLHSYSQQVLYPYSYSCTSTPPSLENLEELAMGLAKAIRLTNGVQYGVTSACEGSVTVQDSIPQPGQHDEESMKKRKKKKSSPNTKQANPRRSHDGGMWPRMESSGGSGLDWFYHEVGVRYAYQFKLRDTGNYGFLLPSSYIVPVGQEALSAVRYFGNFLLGSKKALGEGAEHPEGGGKTEEEDREQVNEEGNEQGRKEDEDEDRDEDGEEDEDEEGEDQEEDDTKRNIEEEEEQQQSTSSFELRRRI